MTRRKLLSLLAGLPLVGRFVLRQAEPTYQRYTYSRAVSADGTTGPWRAVRIGIDIPMQDFLDANAQFGPFPTFLAPDGVWELKPNGPKRIDDIAGIILKGVEEKKAAR